MIQNRFTKFVGGGINSHAIYNNIISLKNLFSAWREFQKGKMKKSDVLEFAMNAESHLIQLHKDLLNNSYCHSHYTSLVIHDPKRREISKASVRDRVLHRAIVRFIEPIFDKKFIFDSYSSRTDKGTHKAMDRFNNFAQELSRNNTETVWVLQCDIKKYFDSVNHEILGRLVRRSLCDDQICELLRKITASYNKTPHKGIPLGNLTSQLFSNVYLDCFDQYVKRILKVKYYIRYADDFLALSRDEACLKTLFPELVTFLHKELKLSLHPNKISIKKWHQGVDFLGWVHFPHYRVLRTKTKKRMLNKLKVNDSIETKASYLGLLKHGNARGLEREVRKLTPTTPA